jgi:hypothetical protein
MGDKPNNGSKCTTPGCQESAIGTSGYTSNDTSNATSHTALGIAFAAPAIAEISIPNIQAKGYLDAADILLGYLEPTFTQIKELYAKIASIKDGSNKKIQEETIHKGVEESFKNLLNKFIESNKNVTDAKILAENLINLKKDTKLIIDTGRANQVGGGKKIISRTHKSINKFLNPKITASNIKSKRFRSTKSKKRRKYY